ncbi:acetyl-CoA synthetase-like protein, partial [Aureobasidium melanogenum]
MMPLFHVGGIVRNLFAPIMAGGSTICCPAFDANLFWDVVEDLQPTWYYASPSMHSVILEEGRNRPSALENSKMRLICNAAGGLLPSLACTLRDTFKCIVLPSYGMTECMPISSPPLDYQLDRSGTSGVSVGPDMAILDGNDQKLPIHTVGRIAVRGAPVFGGYLKDNDVLDTSCFTADGWFDTGDMGYLDADGYLYVTGRSKEVINRGGELISPFEIEEAVVTAA